MFSFEHIANNIIANITGPLSFRFILQPAVAFILGIRDGRLDTKLKKHPFIYEIITNPMNRQPTIKNALRSILISVIIGIITDMIAQHLIFNQVRILPAVVVGCLVISLPYGIARGVTNRICSKQIKK
jgi:hypothetical protein